VRTLGAGREERGVPRAAPDSPGASSKTPTDASRASSSDPSDRFRCPRS
jgi:hypothetical protein